MKSRNLLSYGSGKSKVKGVWQEPSCCVFSWQKAEGKERVGEQKRAGEFAA
jgi:hypothetical protein